MTLKISAVAVAFVATATAVGAQTNIPATAGPGESRLSNMRQLTNTGTQAEAYFSRDGKRITFQSTRDGRRCDQQYVMNVDGTDMKRVSTGGGKTTCGWFLNDGKKLFFGSTHLADSACPPRPDPSKGYVWGIDPFDIFTVNSDGTGMKRLTNYNTYTAEGVLSPDGKTMVFTSLKDGDLDIYTMNIDGTNVKQLTRQIGYDSYHPTDPKELADYKDLLARHLVRPSKMELWVMNADGSDQHQVTHLGGANFGPSWTRDGKQLIFSSNHTNPHSGNFDLYLVNLDGTGLEQITTDAGFDGFPMFSPDGKKLIWASQRADPKSSDVNLYIADWKR
jgi:TolB protein